MIPDDFFESKEESKELAEEIAKLFNDKKVDRINATAALSSLLLYTLGQYYEVETGMKVIHHITSCYLKHVERMENVND